MNKTTKIRLLAAIQTPGGHTERLLRRAELQIAFARDIPALGYRTYLLCEGEVDSDHAPVRALSNVQFETPFLQIRTDRFGSGLGELTDARSGAVLTLPGKPLGAWAFVTEQPKGMTSWILGDERDAPVPLRTGEYGYSAQGLTFNDGDGSVVRGGEAGVKVSWSLTVPGTESTVALSLMLHALEPRLDFTAEVDWREIGDSERGTPGLTIRFPLALSGVTSRYEAPFGSVERTQFAGEEVPTLRYAHLEGQAPICTTAQPRPYRASRAF